MLVSWSPRLLGTTPTQWRDDIAQVKPAPLDDIQQALKGPLFWNYRQCLTDTKEVGAPLKVLILSDSKGIDGLQYAYEIFKSKTKAQEVVAASFSQSELQLFASPLFESATAKNMQSKRILVVS